MTIISPSVVLAHSGKQHSYYTARALRELGYLKRFYTSSYIANKRLQQFITEHDWHYFSRRFLDGLDGRYVSASWQYELKELVFRKLEGNSARVNNMVLERDAKFDNDLSRRLRKIDFDAYWGFQGSCLESLKVSNTLGKLSVCEMTTAHLPFARRILNEEAKMQPEWADSFDFGNFPADYERRLTEEPLAANRVIAISQFLKDTLVTEGVDEQKIDVILLGFDATRVRYLPETTPVTKRPLKLLFAGKVTQRKGMQYLLDAMDHFDRQDVELTIVGNIFGEGKAFMKQKGKFTFLPGISQSELFQKYTDYDVLVFPSILEGFGLVTVEAMGAGLPVITTPNTNAFEILQDGSNGYLVPIRDDLALVKAIERFRSMSNEDFQQMRRNARATALQYTWDRYRAQVAQFVKKRIADV